MFEKRRLKRLISTAPGPSPWYYSAEHPRVSQSGGHCQWEHFDGVEGCEGFLTLTSIDKQCLMLLDFYVYCFPLESTKFALWFQTSSPAPPGSETNGPIRIYLLDADSLGNVEKSADACSQLRNSKKHISFDTDPIGSLDLPSDLAPGSHRFKFPDTFKDVPGLLLLFQSTRERSSTSSPVGSNLHLMAAEPSTDNLAVFPQHWFNNGDLDFGHQWVTRIARDPKRNRIVGDGIRLGSFVLDASNTSVEKWIERRP